MELRFHSRYFFNQSPLFWITNDYVNKYTTTRLRLFYYEPSELGFRLIIVMVVLIGFFLASKCKKEKVLLAVLILVDAFTLYLARSMGAIGIARWRLALCSFMTGSRITLGKKRSFTVAYAPLCFCSVL